jgi:phenylalanyl-tRNA synthetase beta chain
MLLNVDWLREMVPFEGSLEDLARSLTMLGLEVEEQIEPYSSLEGLVVGFIQALEPHQNADKLSVCQVAIGLESPVTIVCGAPNVRQGQYVAVAPVGTSLPDGLQVKKTKIRGIVSEGMICSEKELHLSDDHSGIMILDEDHLPGTSLLKALHLDKHVFDIGITPNRGDCLSVLGIAREVAAYFQLPLQLPEIEIDASDISTSADLDIVIEDSHDCPMYQARIIREVTVSSSPAWMRYRLMASGIRPINAVVDITNYVLLECGHPLHAFDANLVQGGILRVARAPMSLQITTLDSERRSLTSEDILIWDKDRPIAIAGIMGGENSEINELSRDAILECAVFNAARVRKTARRLGLSTEASYRFERGIDQCQADFAVDRAASLIQRYAQGQVLSGRIKNEPKQWTRFTVPFRPSKARSLLAIEIDDQRCADTLNRLGCQIENANHESWTITCPSYRFDLHREVDLVEEIARFYGFENIPTHIPKAAKYFALGQEEITDTGYKPGYDVLKKIRDWGQGVGLQEVINYSFVGRSELDRFGIAGDRWISVSNPLSADQDTMRPFLAPGLLQNLQLNLDKNNNEVRLFEIASVFSKDTQADTLTREVETLGIILYGHRYTDQWPFTRERVDYLDIKGLVEHFFMHTLLIQAEYTEIDQHPYLNPGVAINLQGTHVGLIGRLRGELAEAYHARYPVWITEIDLQTVCRFYKLSTLKYRSWPKFPPVHRDMTLIAGTDIQFADIVTTITQSSIRNLEDISLQDIYVPEHSPERHFTLRMTYRHAQKTLTDKEVDRVHSKLGQVLSQSLPIRFP